MKDIDSSSLPMGWARKSLGSLFRWSNGNGLTERERNSGNYNVYGGNGLIGTHNEYLCNTETIVVGRVGAHCGNVHLAKPYSWITDNAIYASKIVGNVNLKFFYYLLNHLKINKYSGGTGQPYITQTMLNSIHIPLPPLSIQNLIVEKIEELFTKLDYGVNLLKTIRAQLNQYQQSILKYAFEGKLTKEWREVHIEPMEPASKLLEELIEEREKQIKKNREKYSIILDFKKINLKDLPKEWEITRLGDILTFNYGKGLRNDKRDKSGKYPVYGSNGIVGYHSSYLINERCIIIGRKGSVGRVHLSNLPCWPIDTTYYITAPDKINIKFIYYLIKSLNLEFLDKSTAIPGLNRNDAYLRLIPFPPKREQEKMVEEIEKHLTNAENMNKLLENNIRNADKLRQSILKKAFEGTLISQEKFEKEIEVEEIRNKNLKQKNLRDYV